ncbi:hypothetical protein MMPV_006652 [Pyropia vietnamensis]
MTPPTETSLPTLPTPGDGGGAAQPATPASMPATAAAAASFGLPPAPYGTTRGCVGSGCRPPSRSQRGGSTRASFLRNESGGSGGGAAGSRGGSGIHGGGRPAFGLGLRSSDSIDSLDSGHSSDDSTRSVDSLTSEDLLALDTAKRGPSGKAAAAAATVLKSPPSMDTRERAPVEATAGVPAAAASTVVSSSTPASLVAARAALPLRRLNHISFTVREPEATATFFEAVLGYTRIVRPRSFDPAGIWLGWGVDRWGRGEPSGLQVHLIAGRPLARPVDVQSDRDHLSFEADDVEAVAACLRDRGIPFLDEVFPSEGLRQLFFHEPSSHIMVEVCNCQHFAVVPLAPPPPRGCPLPSSSVLPSVAVAESVYPTDTTAVNIAATTSAAAAVTAVTAVTVGASALPAGTPSGGAAAVRAAP